jgi:hypothetical protein
MNQFYLDYSMNATLGPRRPPPDIIVNTLRGTGLYVMRPCPRLAAEWLMSVVGDMPVDDGCIEDTLFDVLIAGFNVSFAFDLSRTDEVVMQAARLPSVSACSTRATAPRSNS